MYTNKLTKWLFILSASLWLLQPCFAFATLAKKKSNTRTHHVNKHLVKKKHIVKKNTHHISPRHRTSVTATACAPVKTNINKTFLPDYLLTSVEKNLVDEVRNNITTLRYTTYKLGGAQIDPSRGVYVVDCSTYVDHILKSIYPNAYTSLTNFSGSYKPTSHDYYQYFQNLSENEQSNWDSIEDVKKLRPGDIIVFRYNAKSGRGRAGHVMIVMDKPVRQEDTFLVRVTDSAPSGHSADTRQLHASGIGIGTLLLKVDPNTSIPNAYAWKIGARWEKNVNFAMARPIDING